MRLSPVLAAVALVATLAGCSTSNDTPAASPSAVQGTVTVYAAASLQATFTELGTEFEAAHPGTTVKFSFEGSSTLLAQLEQGAPADVFATADTPTMDKARDKGLVGRADPFATNVLTIAVAPGNPKGIASLADLTKPGVSLVVCAQPVPCGAAAAKVAKAANVELHPVSEENKVSSVLTKVKTGQADAGLVYRTDVKGAADVASVDFPQADGVVNVYPIAALKGAKNPAGAKAFVDYVRGSEGRTALTEAGFGTPN